MSDNSREVKSLIAENTLLLKNTNSNDLLSSWQGGKSRRMKLLERMGCFGELPQGVTITKAMTLEELSEAYRLVYDNFVKLGYILPNSNKMRLRLFEAMPDTATFVAKNNGKIIGVTSVVIDSADLGLPADKAFSPEIDMLRWEGRKICEGTNWIITPEFRRTSVMTELMRCCFAYAIANGCTDLIADITPSHKSFYELMAFKMIGSERSSSSELDDPVVLVNLPITETVEDVADLSEEDDFDLAQIKVFYLDTNPYLEEVESWILQEEASFLNPEFLREFFIVKTDFLDRCTPDELNIISSRWGEDLFLDVMGHSVLNRTFALPKTEYLSTLTGIHRRPA
jgi:hypothetical protein